MACTAGSTVNEGPGSQPLQSFTQSVTHVGPQADIPFPQTVYRGSAGNDRGISTVGMRTGKYNAREWEENNVAKHFQTYTDIDNSEKCRNEADSVMKEVDATVRRNQDTSTKLVKAKLIDTNFWKTELERSIQDMLDETDSLLNRKKRMENALSSLEIAKHIVTDNINCRTRRYGVDNVEDEVELSLLKELDVNCKVEQLWKKTLDSIITQIQRNRDAKENLEMDWSNKKEADELDSANAKLHNKDSNKQFYPGSGVMQPTMSSPESWAQHSHDNIVRAEHERMSSEQLRCMVDNMFDDNARDMRQVSDISQMSLQKNLDRLTDSKKKMEENLKRNCKEISDMEQKLLDLKEAIRNLDDATKVCQTRLHNRSMRPGVDLCKDDPQLHLFGEVAALGQQMDALQQQVNQCENSLKDMLDTRLTLEKEIACKTNSIFIDKDKVLNKRYRFPTVERFRGFNHV